MTFQTCLIAAMIILSCISKTQACFQINISCPDIKTANGFKFAYKLPERREISEISVYGDKTLIAHSVPSKHKFNHLPVVMSMDNGSVVTRDCRDLRVECILLDGPYVSDYCVDYKTAEKMKTSDPKDLPKPWGLIIGVPFAVLCAAVLVMTLLCYSCRKKDLNVVSLPGFLRHLLTCSCHRNGIFRTENIANEGSEIQEGTAAALETQHSGQIGWSEQPSDTDQHGSGENDIQEDNKQRGDLSAPDVNRASNHQAMNRNVRDDPGGGNDTRGQCIVWINEKHGSQDHVNEGQPLLLNQRASIQNCDMTVEAVALVNKRGFDPDQVSRCSTVPDTDVESMTPNMKNHSINE